MDDHVSGLDAIILTLIDRVDDWTRKIDIISETQKKFDLKRMSKE